MFQIHHYISENIQSYRRTQFNLTLCDQPIKTLLTSQRNQIYSEASLTHFSANNLSYFTLYSSKCSLFQIHHYISENDQTYRGTQFNLTLCDLPINKLLASQRNQIYSEPSSTHFSAINLSYTYALPIILLIDPNKSQTFQYTIRLIAGHSLIWHFAIYQSKNFSPLNAIKYILKHLQHTFQLLIYHAHALLIKILIVLNTSLHFRKLSDLSRNTV